MQMTVVEAWIEGPLKRFVDDAGAELALLLHPSGQVLAQHGFARAVDVMSRVRAGGGDPRVVGRARPAARRTRRSAGCTTPDVLVRYF